MATNSPLGSLPRELRLQIFGDVLKQDCCLRRQAGEERYASHTRHKNLKLYFKALLTGAKL